MHKDFPTGAAAMPAQGVASQPCGGAFKFTTPGVPTELPKTGAVKASGATVQLGTARDYLIDGNRLIATNRKARLTAVSFRGTLSGAGVVGAHIMKNGDLIEGASYVARDKSDGGVAAAIDILVDTVVGDCLEMYVSGGGSSVTLTGSLQAIG